jgi:hypothetical protein
MGHDEQRRRGPRVQRILYGGQTRDRPPPGSPSPRICLVAVAPNARFQCPWRRRRRRRPWPQWPTAISPPSAECRESKHTVSASACWPSSGLDVWRFSSACPRPSRPIAGSSTRAGRQFKRPGPASTNDGRAAEDMYPPKPSAGPAAWNRRRTTRSSPQHAAVLQT